MASHDSVNSGHQGNDELNDQEGDQNSSLSPADCENKHADLGLKDNCPSSSGGKYSDGKSNGSEYGLPDINGEATTGYFSDSSTSTATTTEAEECTGDVIDKLETCTGCFKEVSCSLCIHCNLWLGSNCLSQHRRRKNAVTHTVLQAEAIQYCSHHRRPCSHLCVDCQCMVCPCCSLENCNLHTVCDIGWSIEETRLNLAQKGIAVDKYFQNIRDEQNTAFDNARRAVILQTGTLISTLLRRSWALEEELELARIQLLSSLGRQEDAYNGKLHAFLQAMPNMSETGISRCILDLLPTVRVIPETSMTTITFQKNENLNLGYLTIKKQVRDPILLSKLPLHPCCSEPPFYPTDGCNDPPYQVPKVNVSGFSEGTNCCTSTQTVSCSSSSMNSYAPACPTQQSVAVQVQMVSSTTTAITSGLHSGTSNPPAGHSCGITSVAGAHSNSKQTPGETSARPATNPNSGHSQDNTKAINQRSGDCKGNDGGGDSKGEDGGGDCKSDNGDGDSKGDDGGGDAAADDDDNMDDDTEDEDEDDNDDDTKAINQWSGDCKGHDGGGDSKGDDGVGDADDDNDYDDDVDDNDNMDYDVNDNAADDYGNIDDDNEDEDDNDDDTKAINQWSGDCKDHDGDGDSKGGDGGGDADDYYYDDDTMDDHVNDNAAADDDNMDDDNDDKEEDEDSNDDDTKVINQWSGDCKGDDDTRDDDDDYVCQAFNQWSGDSKWDDGGGNSDDDYDYDGYYGYHDNTWSDHDDDEEEDDDAKPLVTTNLNTK